MPPSTIPSWPRSATAFGQLGRRPFLTRREQRSQADDVRHAVDPAYGDPLLSGRQVLQWYPIALKHLAAISFRDVASYRLTAGTIVYQADGRAEEGLGTPAVVTAERAGWLARGHVGRLLAREGERWGAVYLGFASRKARARSERRRQARSSTPRIPSM